MGLSWADFNDEGTINCWRDRLTIDVRTGRRVGRQDLNRSAGIGSREEDLIGEFLISLSTSWFLELNVIDNVKLNGSADEIVKSVLSKDALKISGRYIEQMYQE